MNNYTGHFACHKHCGCAIVHIIRCGILLVLKSTDVTSLHSTHILYRKQIWKHPKTKKWHCIDFAIMRQRDRKRCLDACVKRGVECNTHHQLLCIKIKVTGKGGYHHLRAKKRFDVSRLTGRDEAGRQFYRELVCRKTTEA